MNQSIKILYVESNEQDARNFQRELGKTSLKAVFFTVRSSSEASLMSDNQSFDIVFLDYHLPGENGLALLKVLRNKVVPVPVVVVTNYADPKIAVQMMQAGASDYIPKSLLNAVGLEQCVRNSLRYSELEQVRDQVELSLKSAEEKLSTIVSNTPVILFSVNPKGEFTFAKGRNLGVFMPEGADLVGESVFDVFDGYDEFIHQMKIALTGNEVTQSLKFGDMVYQISCTPRFNKRGRLEEIVGIAYDVTKRAEAEESLMKAKLLAEQTSKAKQDFIANMSHEIRTPMNAIVGFANLLQDTKLSDVQKDYLQTIQLSGDNLLNLINDILDFSKIEAGKLIIEKEPFVLGETLLSLERVLKGKSDEKKVKLNLQVDADVPSQLIGDANRLYQVLMNLVSNAIKFTDKGSVTVRVQKVSEQENKVKLKFTVTDTGIGIPADKFDAIFDGFSQVSSGTTRKYGGTGLGLAIVRRLIHLQKGTIKVTSELRKGSTFEFELKYALGVEKEVALPAAIISNIDAKIFAGKKILLAEDNRMNQKLIQNLLAPLSVQLTLVDNGQAAVDIMENSDFDLLLLDIQMPILDGFEVATHIRKEVNGINAEMPILAMTAHAFKEEKEACYKAGMNAHISKPIQKQELLKVMQDLLNLSNSSEADVLDLSYLKSLSEGNDAFVREMLTIFSEDIPQLMAQLKVSMDAEDLKRVGQLAHKYRSPLSLLKLTRLEEIMKTMEHKVGEKVQLEEMKKLFEQACSLTSMALESVQREIENH